MLTTRTYDDLHAVPADEWERLLAKCGDSTVFQSRAWVLAWWDAYGADGRRAHVIAVFDGPALVGLAPLFIERQRVLGLPPNRAAFIGEGHSDYQQFCVADQRRDVVESILASLAELVASDVHLELREIQQRSLTATLLRERIERRQRGLKPLPPTPCPRLQMVGNESGVGQVLRKQSLRRHTKKLASRGSLAIQHSLEPAEIAALIPELFAQHVRRWAATPWPSLFNDSRARRFYERMVESLAPSGAIVLTTVRSGSDLVAMHLGLRSKGDFIWYKPTYEPEFSSYSPGEVLLKSLLEYANEARCEVFDFTRGNEPFKLRFASTVDHNCNCEWLPVRWHRRLLRAPREIALWARDRLRSWRSGRVDAGTPDADS